ncbi:hypothetical protein PQX77_006310 [Marasmius sp. AFHP31]|nr:hypothetical protein PQX77_006310 [Marasmius sp. AFHP31]
MYHKIVKELSKVQSQGLGSESLSRIRIIDIASTTRDDISQPLVEFPNAFKCLLCSEDLTCVSSNTTYRYEGIRSPCVAVIDSFAGYAVDAIHAQAQGVARIPVFLWRTSPAGSILRHNGPPEFGGRVVGDMEDASTQATIPGAPPMYEYEWAPQKTTVPANIAHAIWKEAQRVLLITDGVLNVSCSAYEPEAIEAARQWYDSMGKTWYTVGPLSLPPSPSDDDPGRGRGQDKNSEEVEFLDRMYERCGERCVVYIAFGGVPWQTLPDKLWVVIDELIDHGVPFILARPSKMSHVPEDQKTKIRESGIGLEIGWADQEAILAHPATGWFISHGGWNSIQESFVHRVPCIFWPFHTDQPYNAAMISLKYEAGFELLSVREEESGPPMRMREQSFTTEAVIEEVRGLLVKMKGEEGRVVRRNAESLARAVHDSWGSGQESTTNLECFLEKFVDPIDS